MAKRKKNPDALFSTKADAIAAKDFLLRHLAEFPYVNGQVSTLGGEHRAAVMLTVSLDPKDSWKNGILQNSRYGQFSVDYTGAVEHFSGYGLGNMRKSKAKSVTDAGRKLREFLHKTRKENPRGRGKASKRYVVDQEQKGLWYQIGRFAFKARAIDYAHAVADRSGKRTRVQHTFPAAHNHKPL